MLLWRQLITKHVILNSQILQSIDVILVPLTHPIIYLEHQSSVSNPFLANVPILRPLKTPENLVFPGGIKMGILARNELILKMSYCFLWTYFIPFSSVSYVGWLWTSKCWLGNRFISRNLYLPHYTFKS